MKKTKKQQAIEFLTARGWVENRNSRTTKYLEMNKPGTDYNYYLGSAGAVRRGRTVSESISVKLKMGGTTPTHIPTTQIKGECRCGLDPAEYCREHDITRPAAHTIVNLPEAITELVETDALAETLVDDITKAHRLVESINEAGMGGKFSVQGLIEVENVNIKEDEQSSDPTSKVEEPVKDVEGNNTKIVLESCDAQTVTDCVQIAPTTNLASKIMTTRQTRNIGDPVAGMVPNAEQEAIIAAATQSELKALVVAAGAGTGKTATLKMLEQVLPGKIQYTAFNSALVAESKTKFVKADCNTTHSLAFRAVGYKYKHRLNGDRIKSYQVAKMLGIGPLNLILKGMGEPDADGNPTDKLKVLQPDFLAGQITVAIKKFCQSADREIEPKHFNHIGGIDVVSDGKCLTNNNAVVREYLISIARKAWADMVRVDGELPFTHDCYVKIWQLGEGNNKPLIASDYILLDEAQDTAPVFLDILKQQTHATIILVGDDNQQIYEWRGAVNAMASFKGAPRQKLSQSYRFGQSVADVANAVLSTLDEPTDLVMRGLQTIPSRVAEVTTPRCYLYRTNAGAVSRVMNEVDRGRKPHLIGGSDDVVRWCEAAMNLQLKRGTRHPELCCFDTWKEVVEYSKTDEGADMALMVKLVEKFGAARIKDALKDMPDEKDADLVVSTAHRSKGREWDTVKLGPDFPTANKMIDADRRLLYVAATRAKMILDITECPPFCGGADCKGDDTQFIPGIEIVYTQPMPPASMTIDSAAPQSPPQESVKAAADRPTAANTAARNGNGKGIPTDIFTWAKGAGDKWNLRGPKDAKPGDKVKVCRRNGTTSFEVIREVVKRYDDAWIYSV